VLSRQMENLRGTVGGAAVVTGSRHRRVRGPFPTTFFLRRLAVMQLRKVVLEGI
jgi:hypothetical protein